MFKPIYLPTYLAIHLSIYLSIHLIISDICVHIYIYIYIVYIIHYNSTLHIISYYIYIYCIYIYTYYYIIYRYICLSVPKCAQGLADTLFCLSCSANPWSTVRSFRSLPAAPPASPASPAPLRLWFWFSLEWNQTHFGIFIRLSDTNKTCTLTKHHRTNVRWDCEIRLFLQQNAAQKWI